MKKPILLIAIAVLALAHRSDGQQARPVADQLKLAAVMPRGAMVYVQANDLAALMKTWLASPVRSQFYESASFEAFQKSHVYLKLQDRRKDFETAIGVGVDPGRKRDGRSLARLDPSDRGAELFLAVLDGRDPLRELPLQRLERRPLVRERLALLRNGVLFAVDASDEHEHMVRRTRSVPCRRRLGCGFCRRLCGSLEPLFGPCPADDLVALAEADPGPLGADHRPELLEPRVERLDLVDDGRVTTL